MMKKAKAPLIQLNLDDTGRTANAEGSTERDQPASHDADALGTPMKPEAPSFSTVHAKPWLFTDLLRVFLVLLSLVVAGGLILIALPQPTVDRVTQSLETRRGVTQQEKIAFLYLGDEIKDGEFHVRGVVRNITTSPIEQLDAAVRLYSHDGTILQTTVVRMNKETIAPDEIAQFELVYPNYKMEFAKYSVDFKSREGGFVSYKDMRATQ
jgi:hypothetical protein